MDNVSLQQIINRILMLKCRYFSLFPFDYVPILPNETFAILITQPSNMQGEHWVMIANSRHEMLFADSLCRPSFLKQQYKQMMPGLQHSHPRVWGFYMIYAAFHLFKFQQEEITGVHDVSALSVFFFSM